MKGNDVIMKKRKANKQKAPFFRHPYDWDATDRIFIIIMTFVFLELYIYSFTW